MIASLPTARGTFVIAATLVGLLLLGAAGAATVDPHGIGVVVFSVCLGGYALHGVVHLAQALCFRGYVPGVVTTLAVVFPTSAFLYRWLLGTGRVDFQVVVATAAAGLVLFAPVIVVAGHVAHLLDGRRRSG